MRFDCSACGGEVPRPLRRSDSSPQLNDAPLGLVSFKNENLFEPQLRRFLREPFVVLADLHVRVRVGCGGEGNSFRDRELNDFVGGVKLIYRFAPAGGGQLDRQAARGDQIESFGDQISDRRSRAVPVDFDQVEMRETIDQTRRGNLADATKIIGVYLVDIATGELFSAGRNAVEHLIGAVEVMDRAENEIEAVPVFLHPRASSRGRFRVVIQFEAGPDFHVGICCTEFIDFVKVDAGVVAIVIGESDVREAAFAGAIDPRLKERLTVRMNAVALGMGVVVGEEIQCEW
jgi:hypothetical protein